MSRDLGPVTRAMSHEQALGQCRGWLRANHISPVAHSDTAGAAAWVADSDEVGLAALAPPHAADLYGLTLHGTGMEDDDHNMTRFDRNSVLYGQKVSVRVDVGGRRNNKTTTQKYK